MKNKKVFQKAVFIALIVIILFSLVAPAIFSQSPPPAPVQEKLLNGMKLLMWPDVKADKVSLRVRIHSGAAFDPQGKEGLMRVLAANLFPNEAAREFFSEDLGGSLDIVTTYDYIQINASARPEHFLQMLETIASAVSNLGIDKETTAKLRTAQLARVAELSRDPAYAADTAAINKMFGTAPYGRPIMGTADSVQKIDFADLIDARLRFLTADNATVAITGNFQKDLAFRAARRYFGGWLKADKRVPPTFRQPDDFATETVKLELSDVATPVSRAGRRAAGRGDTNYYATLIFNAARVSQRCADASSYQPNLLRGVYWTTGEGDGACSIQGGGSISQEQFEAARSSILNDLRSRIASPAGLADIWLDADTYRTSSPEEEIKKLSAVTLADVKAVAEALAKAPVARVIVQAAEKKK